MSMGIIESGEYNKVAGLGGGSGSGSGSEIYTGTGTLTESTYIKEGNITWQWTGRICRVLLEGVKLSANAPLYTEICSGLPPANGTEFLAVCAQLPTNTNVGFIRTDPNNGGKLIVDVGVASQPDVVKLYASVSYITSEDAHAM